MVKKILYYISTRQGHVCDYSFYLWEFHVIWTAKPTGIRCVAGPPSLSHSLEANLHRKWQLPKKSGLSFFIGAAEFLGDKHNAKLWCTGDVRVYSFLEFDGFLSIRM